ncbi:MAG: aspartate aminotransferase family protein, partial [Crocinitomicaceae bacterium]
LALQYHQIKGDMARYKIVSRWDTYHGNSVFMLDIGGMRKRRESYKDWFQNFPHLSPAYVYRKPDALSEEQFTEFLLNEFEQRLLETDPNTVAAFIAEPVVAAALGAVPPPKGYFKGMKRLCEKYGILFISDEILCGFGRTGENFGINNFDVIPDIIASGKGISGGYFPLSAVLASEKVMAPFIDSNSPFLGGHTFACNPMGAAVGVKVLEIYKEENLIQKAKESGEFFMEKLSALLEFDIVGDVRGKGLLCGVEIVKDKKSKSPFPRELNLSKRLGEKGIEKGIVLYPGSGSFDGVLGDHVLLCPPLTISNDEMEELVDSFASCIKEVQEELFHEQAL